MKKYDNYNWENLAQEYLNEGISLTKLSVKYGINRWTITERFKKLGIEIINKQNRTKFDNTVFDSIDTEEKAYWLGFIFADGYINSQDTELSKNRYCFELSLKGSDIEHLNKFNKFMKHEDSNHAKLSKTKCANNGTICDRCRWIVSNKHLWETLNSYGCTPKKSSTLRFPNKNIFKSEDLIRHFIRGYFDGDGCISRCLHKIIVSPKISIISTPEFLNSIEEIIKYKSSRSRRCDWSIYTQSLDFSKDDGIKFINYIYSDCSIYLDRKFKLYQFFKNGSRSLQEWNELLQDKNGEVCDDNTVLNSEIKESESV